MSRTKHEYTYEDRVRDDKKASDDYDMKHYGTITYSRDPRDTKYRKITAVPVEIEVPWEVDQLVKLSILGELEMTYAEWIEQCYLERMKQILTDPAEFGKLMLPHIKRGHLVEDDDLEV
jgi:hypothetical protein